MTVSGLLVKGLCVCGDAENLRQELVVEFEGRRHFSNLFNSIDEISFGQIDKILHLVQGKRQRNLRELPIQIKKILAMSDGTELDLEVGLGLHSRLFAVFVYFVEGDPDLGGARDIDPHPQYVGF